MAERKSRMDTARLESWALDSYKKLCQAILSDDTQEALKLSSYMRSMTTHRQHLVYQFVWQKGNADLLEIFSQEGFRKSNDLQISTEMFYGMAAQSIRDGRSDLAEIIVSNVRLHPHATYAYNPKRPSSSLLCVAYNAKDRSDELVDQLLLEDFPPCRLHGTSHNHLHVAVRRKDLEAAAKLIRRGQVLNEVDAQGSTALHIAVAEDDDSMVSVLLDAGACVTDQDENLDSPLHRAWDLHSRYMIDQLLHQHVEWPSNPCSRTGVTHLHIACAYNSVNVIKALLLRPDNQPDVNKPDADGLTPLHYAVENDARDAVHYLLNYPGQVGPSELNLASARKLAEDLGRARLAYMIEEYAEASQLRSSGEDPRPPAQLHSYLEMLGADFLPGNNGLHMAVYQANAELVDHYMANAPESFILALSRENLTPLHIAFTRWVRGYGEYEEIMLRIIAGLARRRITDNVEGQGSIYYIHILCAADSPHSLGLVQRMLEEDKGALFLSTGDNTQLFSCYSALHMAIEFDRVEMAQHLFDSGCRVGFDRNEQGQTPLDMILSRMYWHGSIERPRFDYLRLIRLCLEHLDDWPEDDVETYNYTRLHMAVFEQDLHAVKIGLLYQPEEIDVAIDRNCRCFGRCTPLHLAVMSRQYEIAELLVNHGADVNARGVDLKTPLLLVADFARRPREGERLSEVIPRWMRLFLDAGADVNLPNVNNDTVLGLACQYPWKDNIEGDEARISFPSLDDGYDFNLLSIEAPHALGVSPFGSLLNQEDPWAKEWRAHICMYILAYSKIGIEHHPKTKSFYDQTLLRDDNLRFEHDTVLKDAAEREAQKMKDIRLNSTMTLADVLTAHPNHLYFLAGNAVFQTIVGSEHLESEFPIFHGHLRTRNRHAMIRAKLAESLEMAGLPRTSYALGRLRRREQGDMVLGDTAAVPRDRTAVRAEGPVGLPEGRLPAVLPAGLRLRARADSVQPGQSAARRVGRQSATARRRRGVALPAAALQHEPGPRQDRPSRCADQRRGSPDLSIRRTAHLADSALRHGIYIRSHI
ncbi:unnamed protein product [Trichogramma brassicae]|uniref:Uncharacterized protein n=1 Tax=Trichogramma brassicae TaxID=86971 RepID=A0A6H5ISW2_9HYME|nr:unnamed protein product [Trichogramma brassicae]